MFTQQKFDPALFEEIKKAFDENKTVNIKIGRSKSSNINKDCKTIEEFSSEVFDAFIDIMKEQDTIVFGVNGRKNPIKESPKIYYDGLIFHIVRKEYLECLENYKVERLYSFLRHFYVFMEPSFSIKTI